MADERTKAKKRVEKITKEFEGEFESVGRMLYSRNGQVTAIGAAMLTFMGHNHSGREPDKTVEIVRHRIISAKGHSWDEAIEAWSKMLFDAIEPGHLLWRIYPEIDVHKEWDAFGEKLTGNMVYAIYGRFIVSKERYQAPEKDAA